MNQLELDLQPSHPEYSKSALLRGTHWDKVSQKWKASIWLNGKTQQLGSFESAAEAHAAYKMAGGADRIQGYIIKKLNLEQKLLSSITSAKMIHGEDITVVPLSNGLVSLVDKEDFSSASQWKWMAHWDESSRSYRARANVMIEGKTKKVYLHRFIMDSPKNKLVDHKNHDTLDNRRSNLRIANHSQSSQNTRTKAYNKSGLKGAYWHKRFGVWQSEIRANGKRIYLGYFDTPEAAHAAYCAASEKHHGQFSCVKT